ncbi:hypothetical protein F4821DRAFT_95078 [Hypoxylon rubiginosum]|uniref:Uncharacterized protein n=1 Tax=Hypoxylon rubiginosum TaxID=110542 RepID=A0ACC0D5Y4_9PEZI|nr:hypothetical protein F4821DRAFT_95078 [Hypoxylon rubiginosum]
MLSSTARERATVRDMLVLTEKATCLFQFAEHKGTKPYVVFGSTNPTAAVMALAWAIENLKNLEPYYQGWFQDGYSDEEVTIAGCALFPILRYAKELHGRDLVVEEPGLSNFSWIYSAFMERESAKIPEGFYH